MTLAGGFARVALGLVAHREQRAGQLILPERKQKVALVLARIASAFEQRPTVDVFHPRIMAGGDVLRAELVRALEQRAELQMFVAQDARIGRASGPVFGGETADDLLLKFLRVVHHVKRNAQMVAHRAHVSRRPGPARAFQQIV
jgi:hypothetical protein